MNIPNKGSCIWKVPEGREEFHVMSVGGCKRIARGESGKAGTDSEQPSK